MKHLQSHRACPAASSGWSWATAADSQGWYPGSLIHQPGSFFRQGPFLLQQQFPYLWDWDLMLTFRIVKRSHGRALSFIEGQPHSRSSVSAGPPPFKTLVSAALRLTLEAHPTQYHYPPGLSSVPPEWRHESMYIYDTAEVLPQTETPFRLLETKFPHL